jgi:anti-anti-sigma regulatory factor
MRALSFSQRTVTLALLILLPILTLLVLVSELLTYGTSIQIFSTGAGLLIEIALLFLYWRGWELARYVVLILIALLIAFSSQEPFITEQASLTTFIPPALALVLATPIWVAGTTIFVYLILLARAGGHGVYADPITFAFYGIIIGSIILGRLITDRTQRLAEQNAQHAERQKQIAEAQARELADANDLMSTQLDQQKQLLDLVATLETPTIPLAEGVLFAPIVGHIDTRRAQALTAKLLHETSAQRARLVVLDITGVSIIDTAVAKALLNTTQALRLLGCEVTLSGISASIAMTLTQLGIQLQNVSTARNPQEALAQHIGSKLVGQNER